MHVCSIGLGCAGAGKSCYPHTPCNIVAFLALVPTDLKAEAAIDPTRLQAHVRGKNGKEGKQERGPVQSAKDNAQVGE